MPTMTAAAPKPKKRKVRHIRIEGSKKKGYTVSHSLHPMKKQGHMVGYEQDPQPTSFSAGDQDAAHAHITGLMGQMGEPDADD